MYLDRNGIAFRENEKYLLNNDKITVYRPWNRLFPNERWWKIWEVIKTRIIKTPWNRKKWIFPIFTPEAWLAKIINIQLIKDSDLKDTPEILTHIKSIYTETQDFNLLTRIDMKNLNNYDRIDNAQEIKKMYEDGLITSALLPENNVKNVDELLGADNFSFEYYKSWLCRYYTKNAEFYSTRIWSKYQN